MSPWLRLPAEKKPDSWLMSLTSLSQADPRVKQSSLGRLDKPLARFLLLLEGLKMELKLVVKLLRTLELLLLLDEELFFEKDDITLLTLVGLEPSFELLPDSENHVLICILLDNVPCTC